MESTEFFYEIGKVLYGIDNLYDQLAKKAEIPPATLWVLYALNDGNPHSQHDICLDWSLPKSTVNTVIKDLVGKKIVVLEKIEGAKREMNIRLTEKGKEYAQEKLSFVYEFESRVFGRLRSDPKAILGNISSLLDVLNEEAKEDD